MPVDPATLRTIRYVPNAAPRVRARWVAPAVFGSGAALLGVLALMAWGREGATGLYLLATVAAVGMATLVAMVKGWREDGIWGLLYRDGHPLGTALAGDEERDGMVVARWWLVGVACALSALLVLKCPRSWDRVVGGHIFGAAPAPATSP